MQRSDDGAVTVIEAADIIGIHASLLHAGICPNHIQDGLLVCDTAGQYRYRPTGFEVTPFGSVVVICERVYPEDQPKEP